MSELKPCLKCGGDNLQFIEYKAGYGTVACPFCGGEVIEPDLEDGDCVYWIDHDESCFLKIKEVSTFFDIYLEAWNTRHERTCEVVYEEDMCPCCGECGSVLYSESGYCPSCGSRIKEDIDAE